MAITEKQRAALNAIKCGWVQNHRYGYGAWRITGPEHPSVVGRVISLGWAQWVKAPNSEDVKVAALTEAGRKLLDEEGSIT